MKTIQNQNNEIFSVEEAEEIIKAAGTEDLFEKAHTHGEVHPNGKWYWDSQAAGGKGDWRVIKKKDGEKKESKSEEKEKKSKSNVMDGGDFFETYYAIAESDLGWEPYLSNIDRYIERNNLDLSGYHQADDFNELPLKHRVELSKMMKRAKRKFLNDGGEIEIPE